MKKSLQWFMFAALGGCSKEAPPVEKPPAAPVSKTAKSTHGLVRLDADTLRDLRLTTTKARRGGSLHDVTAFGELALHEDATHDVVAPAAGIIDPPLRQIGASVSKGAPLASLRSPAIGSARALVLDGKAKLAAAEQNLARQRSLLANGLAPKREVEVAVSEVAVAETRHRSAQAALGALGLGLRIPTDLAATARVSLRAPRAGTILERPVRPGAHVAAGALVYRIVNLENLRLIGHVYEREAVRLRVGSAVRVELPAFPGERFEGLVSVLTGEVDVSSRTVAVRVDVKDPLKRLRPGMAATATFSVTGASAADVVTVPVAAVQRVEGASCVFIPRGDGVFERREIARGREARGDLEVLKGLKEGEEVVVEGAFLLANEAGRAHDHEGHH